MANYTSQRAVTRQQSIASRSENFVVRRGRSQRLKLLWAAVVATCLVWPNGAVGKVLRGTIKLDGEAPEAYISKFSINEEGLIVGSLRTANAQPFNTG
jgi:hypothetical protein